MSPSIPIPFLSGAHVHHIYLNIHFRTIFLPMQNVNSDMTMEGYMVMDTDRETDRNTDTGMDMVRTWK